MWDWWCFSFNPNKYYPDNPSSHLLPLHHDNRPVQSLSPISLSTMILTSWLSRRRFRRCLCLLLCSPFLLPLLCATCPIICAAEICFRLCRRRRRRSPWKSAEGFDEPRRCEGGEGSVDGGEGTLLLQRYLDDQLLLVIECVYNCGDEEEEDGVDVEVIDSRSPLLQ